MMIPRSNYLTALVVCFSFGILNLSSINPAYAQPQTDVGTLQAKISDIINVANYTYVEVDTGTDKVWAAGPVTTLKKGDTVAFSTAMPMQDFYSESMGRNFKQIYFVSRFMTETEPRTLPDKPPADAQIKKLKTSFANIARVEDGNNIAEIHAEKAKLNGKIIRVRGQVTRFAEDVMGKNWLHIQDNSSFDDLTVTTDNTVAVGDVVVIEGELELDKDFDYGYVFSLIVQSAKVTKE
ncbi:MAG: hypothetical protein ABGX37_09270 [Methylococcales bacterium]